MRLLPREVDKLVLHQAGVLAQRRLARGVRLNLPESTALIATVLLELIRDGRHSVAQLMDVGRSLLGTRNVLPDVPSLLEAVQVEGTFPDGTKLVTVHAPVCRSDGDLSLALWGSFLPVPTPLAFGADEEGAAAAGELLESTASALQPRSMPPPGGVLCPPGAPPIVLNAASPKLRLSVVNTCDRPIQVGSHFPFGEANAALVFDRCAALGHRLHVPAGCAVRFEPGERKAVLLTAVGGRRLVAGGNSLCGGECATDPAVADAFMARVSARGFGHAAEPGAERWGGGDGDPACCRAMAREHYAAMFGPTTGDLVRLGDTGLLARVERDFAVYGDECKFGGGKARRAPAVAFCFVLSLSRSRPLAGAARGPGPGRGRGARRLPGLRHHQRAGDVRRGRHLQGRRRSQGANCGGGGECALGADAPVSHPPIPAPQAGRIAAIGKAGNPDTMGGVTPGFVFGVNTEAIAGEGLILTAGALDVHVHFICPQQADEALAAGTTTMYGGGTGPATGTCATTCTPGCVRSCVRVARGGRVTPSHCCRVQARPHAADADRDRRAAAQLWLLGQGQHPVAGGPGGGAARGRGGAEAARGLGHAGVKG